MKLIPDIDPT